MTREELRRIVTKYQKRNKLRTLTLAVQGFAAEVKCSPGAVWHWMAGERKIRPMVAARIKSIIAN